MALKYTTWKVTDEKELKLRLTSHQAATVEEKIGMNLLKIFMPEAGEEFTLPPLKVMLLLVHGALQQYEHGYSFEDVYDLYDEYVDNGGDQTTFMTEVLMPLFEVSGFTPRGSKDKKTSKEENDSSQVILTVTQIIERLYPMFLDIGGKPLDFWDLTVLEIREMIESYNRVKTQERKEKIIDSYRLSQMISNHVSLLLSNDAKIVEFWEYAPELFVEEQQAVELERQKQALLLHKERMREFAERHNRKRKEEVNGNS
ncbi:prophage protein [Streptococcus pneumoniae]|nr:prophage protein [Streptococcus pneumoniae]